MMETTVSNEFVTEGTREVSERMMQLIREGKIRNHKLGNTSAIHHGALEEKELGNFKNFLKTRNFYDIMLLLGQVKYE